ncbi:MAG: hypothetical protein CEE40_01940 [Chloroflexi bacterium B3_Chlor]|nr:MAG: hypothetical protein CEE40_01940 [Chloroflexi bacterium B3_Chlor]
MSPRARKDKDIESGVEETTVATKMEAAAETSEKAAGVDAAGEGEEESKAKTDTVAAGEKKAGKKRAKKVNLKSLARNLYQMGLDLGLPPDEAALLTSETKLPAFVNQEAEEEFKEGLIEGYQEMLNERVQNLKHQLGVGG